MIVIDDNGKWEVQEGIGCINRLLLEPSQKYINEHLEEFSPQE
jgi:hypothetical protein